MLQLIFNELNIAFIHGHIHSGLCKKESFKKTKQNTFLDVS